MPKGHPLDLDKIQELFWDRADRRGRIRINQADLAFELGITKFTMSRIIERMVAGARIRQISNNRLRTGIFVVEDPEVWGDDPDQTEEDSP